MARIRNRKLKIWSVDYLSVKFLWKNIENNIEEALKYKQGLTIPKVLDVGCGNRPYADLFVGCEYIGMDYSNNDTHPDIIGSAMDIPLPENTFDLVFSTQVIEHVEDPGKMINECFRVLKNDGIFILSGPFYWPLHEVPYDFHRFTKYGFHYYLSKAGFTSIKISCDGGTWAQIFLSICIQIPKWLFPVRIAINLMGILFDKIFYKEDSPANYSIIAYKPLIP